MTCNPSETKRGGLMVRKCKRGTGVTFALVAVVVLGVGLKIGAASPAVAAAVRAGPVLLYRRVIYVV
jgi:hypothetical protein